MGGSIRRGIGVAIAVVGAAWAVLAFSAPAQQSGEPKALPTPGVFAPKEGETPPPLTFEEPDVQPAQFTVPGATTPAPATRLVADPPTPVVRIQVRVAADSPPGDDIKYQIIVQNTSMADAHAVTVRNPIPDPAEAV